MSVDEALSDLSKTIESGQPWPRPRCPNCATGHVRFGRPAEYESYASASSHSHSAFEPEWINGTFTIRGECENPDCKQSVHGTGDYFVGTSIESGSDEPWDKGPEQFSSFYRLSHLHPPMHLMPVPRSAPDQLREGVLRASRVVFADAGLAATALRSVVERFLTAQGVASITHSGKFRNAHQRIAEWRDADVMREHTADLLFAVKWLGNAGTHEISDLTTLELIDGAKLLDEAFHRVYTGPDIDAQAQTINTAEGPSRST
ncbi:DUF4145 domain-containing protein [Herbiconiux sp. YIM B11900]|uniref:DUF4145 domain-containing protein n=1 Tax=Herbiconiux sp. YIM B11900 TaxID=3404131 RepID=UPI003F87B514